MRVSASRGACCDTGVPPVQSAQSQKKIFITDYFEI